MVDKAVVIAFHPWRCEKFLCSHSSPRTCFTGQAIFWDTGIGCCVYPNVLQWFNNNGIIINGNEVIRRKWHLLHPVTCFLFPLWESPWCSRIHFPEWWREEGAEENVRGPHAWIQQHFILGQSTGRRQNEALDWVPKIPPQRVRAGRTQWKDPSPEQLTAAVQSWGVFAGYVWLNFQVSVNKFHRNTVSPFPLK